MSPAVSLSIAIQMDPVGSIDITGDTSIALGLEAQSRALLMAQQQQQQPAEATEAPRRESSRLSA